MTTKLKQKTGEGLAYMDQSSGHDDMYDLLAAMIGQMNDQADQFNQLRTDFLAIPAATTATAVTKDVEAE
jgi:hypothetical protein